MEQCSFLTLYTLSALVFFEDLVVFYPVDFHYMYPLMAVNIYYCTGFLCCASVLNFGSARHVPQMVDCQAGGWGIPSL